MTIDHDRLVAWRRDLHAHPELSFAEFRTTALVRDQLVSLGLDPVTLPGGTGLWCDVGPDTTGCIGLRADLDALPLTETTGLPYASTVEGVCHACGHDAHTAMLLEAATVLAADPPPQRVRLIFQPGEETTPVVRSRSSPRVASPGCPGSSPCTAPPARGGQARHPRRADHLVRGRSHGAVVLPGGHSARPHLTGDLIHAAGVLVTGLASVLDRRLDARTATVLTWGRIHAGHVGNAIPESGELVGTLRSASHRTWATVEPLVRRSVAELLAPYAVDHELDYVQGVPPVVNDAEATAEMLAAIESVVGLENLAEAGQSSGGEDFAWYLEHVPGAMARLGVWDGTSPRHDLHKPDFELDERALVYGARTLLALAYGGKYEPRTPDPSE